MCLLIGMLKSYYRQNYKYWISNIKSWSDIFKFCHFRSTQTLPQQHGQYVCGSMASAVTSVAMYGVVAMC